MDILVMELDRHGGFSSPGIWLGRNVIIFVVLAKGPTQGLEHTISAEKMYSTNFTEKKKQKILFEPEI